MLLVRPLLAWTMTSALRFPIKASCTQRPRFSFQPLSLWLLVSLSSFAPVPDNTIPLLSTHHTTDTYSQV